MKKILMIPFIIISIIFTSCNKNLPISSLISSFEQHSSSAIIEEELDNSTTVEVEVNPLEFLFLNVLDYSYISLPTSINNLDISWQKSNEIISISNNKLEVIKDGTVTLSAYCNGYKKDFEIIINNKKIIKTIQNNLTIHYNFLTKPYKIGPYMEPNKIVLHNTANNASAKNEVNYLHNKNNTSSTSYHFAVDEKNIYQAIPLTNSAYHAGVSLINKTSIGIEIARSTSLDTNIKNKAIENALTLIHLLKQEYSLTNNQIMTHKDASGKHCPHDILDRYGITNLYSEIKEMVEI